MKYAPLWLRGPYISRLDTFLLCEDQCHMVMHHVSASSPHSNNRVYSLVCTINYGRWESTILFSNLGH